MRNGGPHAKRTYRNRGNAALACDMAPPGRPTNRIAAASLLLLFASVQGAVINRVTGSNRSELTHASSGGGTHVYLTGSDIGSAFAPPVVLIGIQAQAECVVQPFTSSNNRLHCIVQARGLPAPTPAYPSDDASTTFVTMPFRVYRNGRLVHCWHVGGNDHGCSITCAFQLRLSCTSILHRVPLLPAVLSAD